MTWSSVLKDNLEFLFTRFKPVGFAFCECASVERLNSLSYLGVILNPGLAYASALLVSSTRKRLSVSPHIPRGLGYSGSGFVAGGYLLFIIGEYNKDWL